MFLFGYLRSQTKNLCPLWLILFSVYAPLLPLAILSWYCYLFRGKTSSNIPISEKKFSFEPSASLDEILSECSLIFIRIGCYMMLFSVLAAFFSPTSSSPILSSVFIRDNGDDDWHPYRSSPLTCTTFMAFYDMLLRLWRILRIISNKKCHEKCRIIDPALYYLLENSTCITFHSLFYFRALDIKNVIISFLTKTL